MIHAGEHEAGAVGVGGRHVLKTYKRQDTKFQPLVFAAVIGIVLVMLLVALVMRGEAKTDLAFGFGGDHPRPTTRLVGLHIPPG